MKKLIICAGTLAVILLMAAFFYRPGTPLILDPAKSRYVVTHKWEEQVSMTFFGGHLRPVYCLGLTDLVAGVDLIGISCLKDDWDKIKLGDGYGGPL